MTSRCGFAIVNVVKFGFVEPMISTVPGPHDHRGNRVQLGAILRSGKQRHKTGRDEPDPQSPHERRR